MKETLINFLSSRRSKEKSYFATAYEVKNSSVFEIVQVKVAITEIGSLTIVTAFYDNEEYLCWNNSKIDVPNFSATGRISHYNNYHYLFKTKDKYFGIAMGVTQTVDIT